MVKGALNVWMNGELVGTWRVEHTSHKFQYAPEWLTSPRCRPLSLSLPISSTAEITGGPVVNYFDNLLPDNKAIRQRIGRRHKVDADVYSLLQAIGRDCVGAVQLLPLDDVPTDWDKVICTPQSEDELATHLRNIPSENAPANEDEFFRISIAGAQEKTAFTRWQDRWCKPDGATPSTHIFKLPLGIIGLGGQRIDATDSVHNEWLCAQILRTLGLPVTNTSIETFAEETVLVVERFDRARHGDWIVRLPQEDFCQALALPPDKKYERDGGPSMKQCLQLLQNSANKGDALFFILSQFIFFLLAAPDGHAKNFSLFLHAGNAYQMTPLYDVLSAWPYIGTKRNQLSPHKAGLAMALRGNNAHYRFNEIHPRHWQQLAQQHGGSATWQTMLAIADSVAAILPKVEAILPADFPVHTWESIAQGMRTASQRFLVNSPR